MAEDVFGIVGTTQANAYKVESVVAEGGFGVVYRAYHGAFRAPVALKCLKIPGSLNQKGQAEFLERFREEAEVMFRLSASIPAVVRPLHVDVISTKAGIFVPFMALEWLEGESLDVMVARRAAEGRQPLSLKKLVRMLSPVARALERAHNFPGPDGPVSIVHRDLKPDNIFLATVNGEEVAKILDFGIAKVRSTASQIAGRASQSEGTSMAFTPGYGAPEQWLPKRYGQTGPWTDVWGLALTVVEAAAGRAIIDGDHAAMMGTAIDEKRRPTPRNEGVMVSDEVEEVFARALSVDPRQRQQDAGLFWDELEKALGLERTSVPVGRRDRRAEDGGPQSREEHIQLDRRSVPSLAGPAGAAVRASLPSGAGEARFFDAKVPGGAVSISPSPSPRILEVAPSSATLPEPPELASEPAPPPSAPSSSPRIPTLLQSSPAPVMAAPELPISAPPPPAAPPAPSAAPPPTPRSAAAPASGPSSGLQMFGDEREGIESPLDTSGPSISLDLDVGGMRGSIPARAQMGGGLHSAPPSARGAPVRAPLPQRPPTGAAASAEIRERLAGPLRITVVGIVLAAADQAQGQFLPEPISLGPVRITWIAGAVAVVGIGMILFRLLWPTDE